MTDTLAVVGPTVPAGADASSLLTGVRDLARSDPGRVALVGDDGELGYAELWQRVLDVAAGLGERPGVVGVPAVHVPETVISLLGVWAAGGTYCPIDPSFPADRVETMLASVRGHSAALGSDAAYVLFTSGSTGRPKPVAVPHRALEVVVPALRELFAITPDDRVLQFASLNWDTAFEEILPTLAAGAAVVSGAEAHTGSLPRLLRMIERQRVSVLDLPTAVWHELVLHLSETGAGLPDPVRLCVIGGEPVNPARLSAWRALPGSDRVRLLNTYGATETALITHAVDLHGPGGSVAGAPIGRPLDHVVQRVTVEGELLVGGPALALGYPGLPEATAERFVELDGERFFRTGDLVGEEHGLLHHLGRLDAQVKVRGIRVDPGEVEALLVQHPGVAAAVVLGVTASERTVLVAYVVPTVPLAAHEHPALVRELRDLVRGQAPCHLHPSRLTIVPALALTASGKADRRATHARFGIPTRPQEATT
jgi:non-ribosomal peptide synthetase component F